MGAGSSAARGFEGVAPAKRRQAAPPPPQRYADPARYDWIPVEGDPDPADVAAASEAPPCFAVPDDDSAAASPGRSHSFSKPRASLNAELARDDAATAESLAAAAASRASGLAGELQLRREVVMMPA